MTSNRRKRPPPPSHHNIYSSSRQSKSLPHYSSLFSRPEVMSRMKHNVGWTQIQLRDGEEKHKGKGANNTTSREWSIQDWKQLSKGHWRRVWLHVLLDLLLVWSSYFSFCSPSYSCLTRIKLTPPSFLAFSAWKIWDEKKRKERQGGEKMLNWVHTHSGHEQKRQV